MNLRLSLKYICLDLILSCFAIGCSGGSAAPVPTSDSGLVNESLSDINSVDTKSPYADVMAACVRIIKTKDSCSLKKIPLIGQEIEAPSIDDVMSRVLVSHAWMGQRFREVLQALPSDILTLLKATTAIVIDADIRPSHFSMRTGAIYLDPQRLWLSNEEKTTINKLEDFRNHYGEDLQFVNAWRYVKDNRKAYKSYALDGTETRELNDILYPVAALLYHELSHANDAFPDGTLTSLNPNNTVYEAFLNNSVSIAQSLKEKYPLQNESLFDLAQILLMGLSPGEVQKMTRADEVGSLFESDGANDMYNYLATTTSLSAGVLREDVAMLFEETMMKYHFNLDRDVGFLQDNPIGEKCNDFILKWGVRNRIADARVVERAKLVASMVIPSLNLSDFFQGLSAPQTLQPDMGWCASINPTSVEARGVIATKSTRNTAEEDEKLESQLRLGL